MLAANDVEHGEIAIAAEGVDPISVNGRSTSRAVAPTVAIATAAPCPPQLFS